MLKFVAALSSTRFKRSNNKIIFRSVSS